LDVYFIILKVAAQIRNVNTMIKTMRMFLRFGSRPMFSQMMLVGSGAFVILQVEPRMFAVG